MFLSTSLRVLSKHWLHCHNFYQCVIVCKVQTDVLAYFPIFFHHNKLEFLLCAAYNIICVCFFNRSLNSLWMAECCADGAWLFPVLRIKGCRLLCDVMNSCPPGSFTLCTKAEREFSSSLFSDYSTISILLLYSAIEALGDAILAKQGIVFWCDVMYFLSCLWKFR